MSLRDLLLLYLVIGCCFAIVIYRSSPETNATRLGSAALAVPLWPLWAPIALTARRADAPLSSAHSSLSSGALERVKAALSDAVASTRGTPLATLLPPESASRIEARWCVEQNVLARSTRFLARKRSMWRVSKRASAIWIGAEGVRERSPRRVSSLTTCGG